MIDFLFGMFLSTNIANLATPKAAPNSLCSHTDNFLFNIVDKSFNQKEL